MKTNASVQDYGHFSTLTKQDGVVLDFSGNEHPTLVRTFGYGQKTDILNLPDNNCTHFGFVHRGVLILTRYLPDSGMLRTTLHKGMYFSLPGSGSLLWEGGIGKCVIISRLDYSGLFHIGGPIEPTGRLKYIDGCSDTLLVAPPKLGDACLNHIHFPPNVRQKMHTHPSLRIGMVYRGRGNCFIPSSHGENITHEIPLEPGVLFLIPKDGQHSFVTLDEPLDFIAYHPDSDCGPTDKNHPMIRRTMIDGKSAAEMPEIQTKEIV